MASLWSLSLLACFREVKNIISLQSLPFLPAKISGNLKSWSSPKETVRIARVNSLDRFMGHMLSLSTAEGGQLCTSFLAQDFWQELGISLYLLNNLIFMRLSVQEALSLTIYQGNVAQLSYTSFSMWFCTDSSETDFPSSQLWLQSLSIRKCSKMFARWLKTKISLGR